MNSSPAIATVRPNSNSIKDRASRFGLSFVEVVAMGLISTVVLVASYGTWWSIGVAEAWGFVTGGICVWLVVREHVWNWPVGLANNVFFFVLFLKGRLYADMSLQLVYLCLGIYGWLNWVFGGQNQATLPISRTKRSEWLLLVPAIPVATWVLMEILIKVNGAAPLWDSLTTVLSLAAQYLLCRKRFENWFFWIAADLIYIPLYFSRQLPLTAVLYGVFLCMCLVGLRQWSKTLRGNAV
ncbi:MAG TPA: nicotinamide riboside transporter PnuC [Clostridia bacterium]|nr:nicotinamide riboside transporter PnuC [Clostridia bacterium]